MREAKVLIAKQGRLLTDLAADLNMLKDSLRKGFSGEALTAATDRMNVHLKDLAELNRSQERFLAKANSGSMADYVQAQPASEDRDVALRLLFQIDEAIWQLRDELAVNGDLLENAKNFAAYHINVLSQTVADTTYGPPGNKGNETVQGRKMFEANV